MPVTPANLLNIMLPNQSCAIHPLSDPRKRVSIGFFSESLKMDSCFCRNDKISFAAVLLTFSQRGGEGEDADLQTIILNLTPLYTVLNEKGSHPFQGRVSALYNSLSTSSISSLKSPPWLFERENSSSLIFWISGSSHRS